MRAFIVLCLVAAACAQYNYQAGGDNGVIGSSAPSAGPSYGGVVSGPSSGDSGVGPSFGASSPSFAASGPAYGGSSGGPSFGSPSSGPSFVAGGPAPGSLEAPSGDAPAFVPQGELEKEFFTFSANDEDFNQPEATNQIISSVKRGLRVVFIKGPDNRGLEDAALNLAKQAADQKTAIYVLNKQADLAQLANRLNNENKNINNKPEVHFVKYRTPEDAANAQKAIQSQYDQLGGPSKNIDGGVAPSLNFASQAPVSPAGQQQGSLGAGSGPAGIAAPGQQGSFGAGSGPAGIAAPGNVGATYLPASVLRRFRF